MKSVHMLPAQLPQQDVKQKFECIMIAYNSSQTKDSPKDLAIFQLQQLNFPKPPRVAQVGSKGWLPYETPLQEQVKLAEMPVNEFPL